MLLMISSNLSGFLKSESDWAGPRRILKSYICWSVFNGLYISFKIAHTFWIFPQEVLQVETPLILTRTEL